MAKKGKKKGKWAKSPKMTEFEDHRPLSQRFMRGLIPLAAILLVLYAAAQLLSRTEGCRVLVAERIEEHVGRPVSIDHMWTDWSLDLHASGLRTEGGFQQASPGLEVGEIILRWKLPRKSKEWRTVRRIEVKGMKLSLVLDGNNEWQPAAFAPLATWLVRWGRLNLVQAVDEDERKDSGRERKDSDEQAGAKTEVSKSDKGSFWQSVIVELDNSEVRWWETDGTEAASAVGIRLQAIPLSVPQRDMHHYVVGIDRVRTGVGEQVEDLYFELITTMGHHIVLGFKANWQKGPTALTRTKPRPAEPVSAPAPAVAEKKPVREKKRRPADDQRSAEELADYFRDMLQGAVGAE